MGNRNGSHYTCYPPINQLTFLIPAMLFSKHLVGSTIVMRLLIIAADIGTIYFGKKILAFIPERVFQLLFRGALTVIAVKLIIDQLIPILFD